MNRVSGAAAACLLGALAAGCNTGPRVGEVRGKVTFDGQPLPAGLVTFSNEDNTLTGSAYLKEDGTFTAKSIPAGPVRVTVKTDEFKNVIDEKVVEQLKQKGVQVTLPDRKERGTKYVAIPAHYGDRDKSGLKYDVKSGGVTDVDITLTK